MREQLDGPTPHGIHLLGVDRTVDGLRGGEANVLPVERELQTTVGTVDHREAVEQPVPVGLLDKIGCLSV